MDSPSNHLDAWIEASLQHGASVTPQQKQFAWERLSAKAMEQALLPAVVTFDEKSHATRAWEAGGLVWRWLSAFATDEERYERARRNRHMMRYHYFNASGEIAIHFLSPLRLSI